MSLVAVLLFLHLNETYLMHDDINMEKCFEEVHEPCTAGICSAKVGFVSPSGGVKSSVIHLSCLFGHLINSVE